MARGPGAFGEVRAFFTTRGITATPNVDYLEPVGEVILSDGMDTNTINITIQDDTDRETAEELEIKLTSVSGMYTNSYQQSYQNVTQRLVRQRQIEVLHTTLT